MSALGELTGLSSPNSFYGRGREKTEGDGIGMEEGKGRGEEREIIEEWESERGRG